VLVTPMQVARMLSAVATGGTLHKPRLVQRVESAGGALLYNEAPLVNGVIELSPMVWAFLQSSLLGVVNEGTGYASRLPGIDIAGKTGTAQIIANSKAEKGEDHAWFASFAPVGDPRYVVVVMVERGGKGGQVAAPIAKEIYKAIFLEKVT
jgi:cell division protein FtsI/penicillin-binding protein 2